MPNIILKPHREQVKIINAEKRLAALDLSQFERRVAEIEELLIYCSENYCSDLYIKVNDSPYIMKRGVVYKVPCYPTDSDVWARFEEAGHISNENNDEYMETRMLDVSVEVHIPPESYMSGVTDHTFFRYRASFGFSGGSRVGTFRMITLEDPNFEMLNFPEECVNVLRKAYSEESGIIFLTGPTGSGKTTTQTACFNDLTEAGGPLSNKVIIGLEDPIEYVFKERDNVKINQKELNKDFLSFELGVKQALREHPNIILVGECRDKPVINAAIEAARTGHLVSTSFHAADVGGTINRLAYHLDNDINLVYDLIINLKLIMSQRMIKGVGVDTQFVIFNDEITMRVLDIIQSGKNITTEINSFFHDENLIKQGFVKDWSYKK